LIKKIEPEEYKSGVNIAIQTQQRTSEWPLTVTRPHLQCASDHTLPLNVSPETENFYTTTLHYLHNRLFQSTVISPLLEP